MTAGNEFGSATYLTATHKFQARGTRSAEESVPRQGRRGPSGQDDEQRLSGADRVPCADSERKATLLPSHRSQITVPELTVFPALTHCRGKGFNTAR